MAARSRVLGQVLKVRARMGAARRRLHWSFAELGEEVYGRLKEGRGLAPDERLDALRERIDGLKAELRLQEAELCRIVQQGPRGGGREEAEAEAEKSQE